MTDTPADHRAETHFAELCAQLRAMKTERDAAYNLALEDAAKVAKVAWMTVPEIDDGSLRNADHDMQLCDYAAAAIRALKKEG